MRTRAGATAPAAAAVVQRCQGLLRVDNNTGMHAGTRRHMSTYTSTGFRLQDGEVTAYLKRKGAAFQSKTLDEVVLKSCPGCKNTRQRYDNLWKLYVNKHSGAYYCHRCSSKGSWFDFKRLMGDLGGVQVDSLAESGASITGSSVDARQGVSHGDKGADGAQLAKVFPKEELVAAEQQLGTDEFADVRTYLTGKDKTQRSLSEEVLRKYRVGATTRRFQDPESNEWRTHKCMVFPWVEGEVVKRVKVRSLDNKGLQRTQPAGGQWGMFGWHTVDESATELVLTEGEFDAMAVHQATGLPAVSLPNGAGSLPIELLPQLERFRRIYLWMDNDIPGQEGAQKFAKKLGVDRTLIVNMEDRSGAKDANDALRMGLDLGRMIERAQPMPHKEILTFDKLRDEIALEIMHPEQVAGVQGETLPGLNKLIKGHRKGELTIFTGPTGVGKTTLLSQISLDLARQGVQTLWGSFEIKNTRLAKKMLTQYAGETLEGQQELFDAVADEFAMLPLYFLRFFGSTGVDKVLDAMEYAVYVYDVEHILLDNLQFMLSGQGKGFERFDMQDDAIQQFRKFASAKNVHISLVIHPRKEDPNSPLTTSSVFGTAKATQEADNVMIMQRGGARGKAPLFLEVTKNRYDGEVGQVPLLFDKGSLQYHEEGRETVSMRVKGGGGMADDDVVYETAPVVAQQHTNQHVEHGDTHGRQVSGRAVEHGDVEDADEDEEFPV